MPEGLPENSLEAPQVDAKGKAGKGRPWTSEEASAAARKRWDRQRAGDAEVAATADAEVLVPISRRKIIEALRRKAEGGDVQAARLVLEHPIAERPDVLGLLSREQRATVRGWLEERRG